MACGNLQTWISMSISKQVIISYHYSIKYSFVECLANSCHIDWFFYLCNWSLQLLESHPGSFSCFFSSLSGLSVYVDCHILTVFQWGHTLVQSFGCLYSNHSIQNFTSNLFVCISWSSQCLIFGCLCSVTSLWNLQLYLYRDAISENVWPSKDFQETAKAANQ